MESTPAPDTDPPPSKWDKISVFVSKHRKVLIWIIAVSVVFGFVLSDRAWAATVLLGAWRDLCDDLFSEGMRPMIIGALIAIVAILIVRRVRGHEEAKDWLFEGIVGVIAVFVVAALMFLANVVWRTPSKLYNDTATNLVARTTENVGLTKTNSDLLAQLGRTNVALAKAQERIEQLEKPEPGIAQITNLLNRSEARMEDRFKRQEKLMAEQGRLSSETLTQMVNKTLDAPKIESSAKIDLSTAAKVSSFMMESQVKEAAKVELARRKAAEEAGVLELTDEQFLAFETKLVDHHVSAFSNTLHQLASEHGDKIRSTYTSAAELSKRPHGQDLGVIAFEKNPSWKFDIYFRNHGPANYSWEIYGAFNLTIGFAAENFTYHLVGGGVGVDQKGGGRTFSLANTNLIPDALSAAIGIQTVRHPLTNFTANAK